MGAGLSRTASCYLFTGNPLLLGSATPPDLRVGRAYGPALCFRDAADKELFDPLPDIKVHSSVVVSLGLAERAEFCAKTATETFGTKRERSSTADGLAPNGPFGTTAAAVFGYKGGRLVAPNTGEFRQTGCRYSAGHCGWGNSSEAVNWVQLEVGAVKI